MHIVHVGKYYWPYHRGIETYLKLLCERLCREVELEVLVTHPSFRTWRETVNGVRVTRMGRIAEVRSMSICPSLPLLLRRLKPDIVHIHLPNPWAEWCYFLAGAPGKLVVSLHSDIIRQQLLLHLHKGMHDRFLRRAAKVIVASPRHIEFSPFLSRLPEGKCVVIPYGIEPEQFARRDDAAIAGIIGQTGTPLVLFAGHLVYYKGVEILIDAAAQLKAHVAIVGAGPLEQVLRARAAERGIGPRIHFLGDVDDATLRAAYQACDVFCLPSTQRSEAFGIVQLEAFAAGKPVVSTNLPSGVPFVNRDGETGLVVPPGDAGALATALGSLLTDPARRAAMGSAAQARVRDLFTADRMAADTLAVYRSVLCQGR